MLAPAPQQAVPVKRQPGNTSFPACQPATQLTLDPSPTPSNRNPITDRESRLFPTTRIIPHHHTTFRTAISNPLYIQPFDTASRDNTFTMSDLW